MPPITSGSSRNESSSCSVRRLATEVFPALNAPLIQMTWPNPVILPMWLPIR